MENFLGEDNILTSEQIENLLIDDVPQNIQEKTDDGVSLEVNEPIKEAIPDNTEEDIIETTEVDVDNLFVNSDSSESVGSGNKDDNQEVGEDITLEDTSASPNSVYSSMASALKNDNVLPNLEDEDIAKIKTAGDLAAAFKKQVDLQLKESLSSEEMRVKKALDLGVEPDVVNQLETNIRTLDSITDEHIKDESQTGENLRKNIIYQDYVNKGFSKERALREVSKSFTAGTDLEDAQDSLQANREFYKTRYEESIKSAEEAQKAVIEAREKEAETLKKDILGKGEIFEGLEVNKETRERIYDAITKPVAKAENGIPLNAIQKYAMDNRGEFFKKIGAIYVMTDGFKSIDKLVKPKVNKATNSKLKEMEHVLKNSVNHDFGGIDLVSGSIGDDNSKVGSDWQLDESFFK